jgi:hypothetical protein
MPVAGGDELTVEESVHAAPAIGTKSTLVKGKPTELHTIAIDGKEIVIAGRLARIARLADEWYEDVEAPDRMIAEIKKANAGADIFTFWQRLPHSEPKHNYYFEPDSIAAVRVTSADHWRKTQLNPKSRNLLKKSAKVGLTIRQTEFDDDFVRGMAAIFNESPVRQGKPFWHYGKGVETIRQEFSQFLFREELFGAYYNDELIGFIFLAYAGQYALLGQIISKIEHRDKAPNNALIAKAVEVCEQKQIPYLVYAKWTTGTLGHFKQQNGFEQVDLPRYYVPLTLKGRVILKLGLHHGFGAVVPKRLRSYLVNVRNRWYSRQATPATAGS